MIKSIRIKNYKSLIDVGLDLAPVTVLIGKSGTGKSNFVGALRYLRDVLSQRNRDLQRAISLPAQAPVPLTMEFALTFDVPGVDGVYSYLLAHRFDNQHPPQRVSEEKLEFNGEMLFHQRDGKWVKPPGLNPVPQPQGIMLDALSSIPEVLIASLSLTQGLGCYDFPGTVFQGKADSNGAQKGLADNASNYLAAIDRIVSNLQDLTSWREINIAMKQLDPSITGVTLQLPQRAQVFVAHGLGNTSMSFNLAQQSEGFRRFLAHMVAIYQQPSKQVLLFEEPEKGIYPGALAVLADYFKSASASNRGQIILTTHSPQLLDHFLPESIRVVRKENLATTISPLNPSDEEALRKQLLIAGELLTVTEPAPVTAPSEA